MVSQCSEIVCQMLTNNFPSTINDDKLNMKHELQRWAQYKIQVDLAGGTVTHL